MDENNIEIKIRAKDGKAHSPSGLVGKYEQGGQPPNAESVWVWNETTQRLEEMPKR